MSLYKLKLNPLKYAFGVTAGNFLGYMVHKKGIQVDANKTRAIIEAKPPTSKKELQRFLGKVNFLRRFIPNTAGKTKVFFSLLKLKENDRFEWRREHQEAFESIKNYLAKPTVLMLPRDDRSLKLYLAAAEESMGVLLAQDNDLANNKSSIILVDF